MPIKVEILTCVCGKMVTLNSDDDKFIHEQTIKWEKKHADCKEKVVADGERHLERPNAGVDYTTKIER